MSDALGAISAYSAWSTSQEVHYHCRDAVASISTPVHRPHPPRAEQTPSFRTVMLTLCGAAASELAPRHILLILLTHTTREGFS